MAWNYERIKENGKRYSYYGMGQEWNYTERGKQHSIKVTSVCPKENGVQYYLIAKDGVLDDKLISAARLHYLLNQKQAQEVEAGRLVRLPMTVEEVEAYFKHLPSDELPNCPECGGTGTDKGKICRCARRYVLDIEEYNAELRLKKLTTV